MAWLPRRLSVRLLLASAVKLLLVGTALGLLGYATGRREGLERLTLERQRHQLTALSEALSTRLAAPRLINRSNLLEIKIGELDLNNFDHLARHFWSQMQLYPVGYINYGTADGSFIGVERLDTGELVLNEDSASPLGRGRLGVYAIKANGQRGRLLEVVPGMETFHTEAWYADTVKANRPSWSRIYQWEDKPEVLAISFNAPVRGSRGQLLGVIGVDFVLSQLNTWLRELWRGQQGIALIVEPNGLLVASSRTDLPLLAPGRGQQRARLDQLSDPLARAAARTFDAGQASGNRKALQTLSLAGHRYSLEAQPWGRAEGLNWLLITALQEDTALASSHNQTTAALIMGAMALVAAVLLNRQLLQSMLAPLQTLQQQAEAQLNDPSLAFKPELSREAAQEVLAMADAFGDLVVQLQRSQRELAEAARRERLKDAQALELLKLKLRSSLEASAVAHEIKNPLSQILLSAELLQQREGLNEELSPAAQAQLRTISAAAAEVVSTIEKMRTLLRNVQTEHQPLNLAHVVRSALLYSKPALTKAAISVTTHGLDSPCWVNGDSAQLQIAIVNLLRNSIEALQGSSGQRLLQITLQRAAGDAVLQIDDSGPGFPPQADLLEPLETHRAEGSGLGLFVVQTTLENHGGSIDLGRSKLGGAAVTLRLPSTG